MSRPPDDDQETSPAPSTSGAVTDTGRYMCIQNQESPPVEPADAPARVDLTQDAVLTVLEQRAKRGDGPCESCEAAVNRDAGLAWRAYARARIDFYRKRRGMLKRPIRLEPLDESALALPDEVDEDVVEQAESLEIVRRVIRRRAQRLSQHQMQQVLVVMIEAQQVKRSRREAMPDRLRTAISRLRKATGLPLDTSLL
jgi:hypothetical protein